MIIRVASTCTLGLLLGLACYAPADKLLPRLIPQSAPLKLYEVSGTVLNGQAGFVEFSGIRGNDLNWSIKPLSTLWGRLSAEVLLGQNDGIALASDSQTAAAGFISAALSGNNVKLRDFSAQAPISELQRAAKLSYLPVAGQAHLQLEHLDLVLLEESKALWPENVAGRISVSNIDWKLGKAVPIGQVSASILSESTEEVVVNLDESDAAKLDLRGQATLKSDFSYSTQIQLKAKSDTPKSLSNQLKALGRTDQQGWYQLKNNGKLPGF